jgi:hypothetical protein
MKKWLIFGFLGACGIGAFLFHKNVETQTPNLIGTEFIENNYMKINIGTLNGGVISNISLKKYPKFEVLNDQIKFTNALEIGYKSNGDGSITELLPNRSTVWKVVKKEGNKIILQSDKSIRSMELIDDQIVIEDKLNTKGIVLQEIKITGNGNGQGHFFVESEKILNKNEQGLFSSSFKKVEKIFPLVKNFGFRSNEQIIVDVINDNQEGHLSLTSSDNILKLTKLSVCKPVNRIVIAVGPQNRDFLKKYNLELLDFGWFSVFTKFFNFIFEKSLTISENKIFGFLLFIIIFLLITLPLTWEEIKKKRRMKESMANPQNAANWRDLVVVLLYLFCFYYAVFYTLPSFFELNEMNLGIYNLNQPDKFYILNLFGSIDIALPSFLKIGFISLTYAVLLFDNLITPMTELGNSSWFSYLLFVLLVFMVSKMTVGTIIFMFFTIILRTKMINYFGSKENDVVRIS